VSNPEAPYWGGRFEERSLVPLGEARLDRIGLDEWLRRSRAKADPTPTNRDPPVSGQQGQTEHLPRCVGRHRHAALPMEGSDLMSLICGKMR